MSGPEAISITKHPSEQQLSDFLNGLLPESHQRVIENHVHDCDRCACQLESVNEDTLNSRLRAIATHFDAVESDHGNETEIPPALLSHDRYEIIERIGVGGMGNVFRARQRSMDRDVAIKVLRPHLFQNDRAIARFQNEIRVAAKLNHPSIVHSYDAEVASGMCLLVMELVDGKKLSDVVYERSSMDLRSALNIAIEIAEGLKFAHSQGTIHRDIKPQNIMIPKSGGVKITDFGLAKFVRDTAQDQDALTFEGETFGTPDYVAPEQIRDSSAADFRSDIYSLGCTLYFMLARRPPFSALSTGGKLAAHLEQYPPPIDKVAENIPAPLAMVIKKMINKSPSDRFHNYDELIRALRSVANDLQGAGQPLAQPSSPRASLVSGNTDSENTESQPIESANTRLADHAELTASESTAVDWNINVPGKEQAKRPPFTERLFHRRLLTTGLTVAVALFLCWGAAAQFGWFGPAKKTTAKIAVIVPSQKLWHPEVSELHEFLKLNPSMQVEYIADEIGHVTYSGRNRDKYPAHNQIKVDRTLDEVTADEFDAAIFFGGWHDGSTRVTRYAFDPQLNQQAKTFVNQLLAQEKPVGAVCGGTAVLVNAGILDGKRAAFCRYIRSDISEERLNKVLWSPTTDNDDESISVRDGLLVTGGSSHRVQDVARIIRNIVFKIHE